MNNNSIFDIFEYLGIPVTDDPEVVRKTIDSLKVGTEKYKNLYSNPKFSQIRNKIYTKNNSAFLAYVQEIIELRQSNQQNYNQQDYNQEELLFEDNDNLEFNKANKKSSCLGCVFLIFVCSCIVGGIGALFDSGSTTLSKPVVKFNDVDRYSVRISWEPVDNADYYILENKSDDLPESERKTEIRYKTEYVILRQDNRKTEYSLSACSDNEKYTSSSPIKINIESVKSHSQESENETEEELEDSPEDDYTPSVLTPETSGEQKFYSSKHYQNSHFNNSPGKIALDAPQPHVVETNNSVVLLWDRVKNANRYRLEIRMGVDGKSYSRVLEDNMYTFSTLKTNKEYFFTVTALPKDETLYSPSTSKTISYTLYQK